MNNKNLIIKHEASTHFKNDEYDNNPSLSHTKKFKFKTEAISEDNKNVIVISDEEKTPVKRRFEPIQLNQTELFKKHMSSYIKQGFSITKARKFAKLSCILKNTNADTNGQPIIPQDFDFEKVNMKEVGCHKLSGAARKRRAILLRKGFSMKEATVLCYNKMRWCKDQRKKRDASVEYIEEMREKHPNRSKYKLMNLKYKPRHLRGESENRDNNDADRDSPVTFTKTSDDTSNITTKRIGLLPSEYPSKSWTTIQFEILQQCILNAIRKVPIDSGKPNFAGCIFKYGFITLIYNIEDSCTENWIKSVVPTLKPWPNFSVRIVEEDLPCPQIFIARFPYKTGSDNEIILKKIESQNKGLGSKKWEVLYRNEDGINIELTLGIDPISVNSLDQLNYQIKYGSNSVYFTRKDIKTNDDSKPKNKSISSTEDTNDGWIKRLESVWNDNRKREEYTNMAANFETNQDDDSSSYFGAEKPQHRSESEWSVGRNRFVNENANSSLSNFKMQQNQQYNFKHNCSKNEQSRYDRRFPNDKGSAVFRYFMDEEQRSENERFTDVKNSIDEDEISDFMHSMTQRQYQQHQRSENESSMGARRNMNNYGNFNSSRSMLHDQQQRSDNESSMVARRNMNDYGNFNSNPSLPHEQQQNKWSMDGRDQFNDNGHFTSNYSRPQGQQNEINSMSNNERFDSIMQQQHLEQKRYERDWLMDVNTHINDNHNSNSRFSFLQERQCQEQCSDNQQQRFENNSFVDDKRSMNDDGYCNSNFSLSQQQHPHQHRQQQNYENKWFGRDRSPVNESEREQYCQQQEFLQNQWCNRERSTINDSERSNQSYTVTQHWDKQQHSGNEWSMRFNRAIEDNENSNSRFSNIQQEQYQQRLENERYTDLERHENRNRYSDLFERRKPSDSSNNCSAQKNFRNDWSPNSENSRNHWRSERNNSRFDMPRQNYSSNNNDMNMPSGSSRWPQWQRNQY